jgi:hypothetical protein
VVDNILSGLCNDIGLIELIQITDNDMVIDPGQLRIPEGAGRLQSALLKTMAVSAASNATGLSKKRSNSCAQCGPACSKDTRTGLIPGPIIIRDILYATASVVSYAASGNPNGSLFCPVASQIE